MYQLRFLRECNPSLSVISAAFIALGRSCLFAKISSTASLSSSSANMRMSSSFASPIRSLSLLSTTNIRPYRKSNNQLEISPTIFNVQHTTQVVIKTINYTREKIINKCNKTCRNVVYCFRVSQNVFKIFCLPIFHRNSIFPETTGVKIRKFGNTSIIASFLSTSSNLAPVGR